MTKFVYLCGTIDCIVNKNKDSKTNQNMNKSKSGRSLYISLFCFLSVFFFGMLIIWGVPMYNDSKQYIDMHVHREPVYPLFLWIMRLIAGENSLVLAGVLQCAFAVYASYRFITYVLDNIVMERSMSTANSTLKASGEMKKGSEENEARKSNGSCLWKWLIILAITATVLTPYIITPLISVTHVMLANGILSEALALPLFLLYVVNLHRMMVERKTGSAVRRSCFCVGTINTFLHPLRARGDLRKP